MTDRRRDRPAWLDQVLSLRPTVLLAGGFLTSPLLYRQVVPRLMARGAADVVIANVWTPDWLLVVVRGLGPILTRTGRALLLAGERSAASPLSLGAPVLAIGHSAGGMSLRLLTSPEPFAGRKLDASGRIGALVTLGTPHRVSHEADVGERVSAVASAFAERVIPGPAFAPRVGYVTVASRAVVGDPEGDGRVRTAYRFYRGLLGTAADGRDRIAGDGLIPIEAALLPGTEQLILDDTIHGQFGGMPWYGSEERIDAWWPAAIDAWRRALEARRDALGD
jgi:hypothetical protein